MQLGTATAEPGTTATGFLDVAQLPTGVTERLPVILVEGERDGPELWITATVHGNEANGLAVAQDVTDALDPGRLRGSVVCLPTLNPAGLRRNERTSYYGGADPNRCFPESEPDTGEREPPSLQELIVRQVYDAFEGAADALLDLHTAAIGTVPFLIRHRVRYGDDRTETEAEALAAEQERLMEAFGLGIVNQYEEYTDRGLHRSATGAALDLAGIPAMTVELGGHSVVDDGVVAAGVAGCLRVVAEMGMIETVQPDVTAADPGSGSPVGYPVMRAEEPHAPTGGIVRHRIEPGAVVEAGDPVADVVDVRGRAKATVEAVRDGYLLGRREGIAVYENDPIASMAVRDEGSVVVPRSREE